MTISLHNCQCHQLSRGLCATCEASLAAELHELENAEHDRLRSEFDAANPPSAHYGEEWPR